MAAVETVFIYEFFFQGFIMGVLEFKLQQWAIMAQAIIFLVVLVMIGGLSWAFMPYIIFAPFAGLIVYKSRSIFYSSALQILILIILDASVVRLAAK